MQSYRIGNDIPFRWPIYTGRDIDRIPFDLTGRKLTLEAISKTGKSYPIEMTVDGNIVQATFFGKDQKALGKYKLVLTENKGEAGMRTIDRCDFLELVDCSCKATGGSSENIHYDVLELSGAMVSTYSGVVDSDLSETSANPVENRVVTKALNAIGDKTAEGLDAKLDKDAVVQESGTGTDKVMSQKVVTELFEALAKAIELKQEKLTAGRGISIEGGVISSTLDTNPFVVVSSLPATGDSEKIYLVPAEKQEEGNLTDEWIWNSGKWERLGSAKVDLTAYAKTEDVEAALEAKQDTISDLDAIRSGAAKGATALQEESDPVYLADKPSLALKTEIPDISGKVDKEVGMGLSSNDYTDAEKAKLAGLRNYDDSEVRGLIAQKANDADLANVAKTGKYSDLLNTPIISQALGDGIDTLLSQKFLSDVINRLYRLLGYNDGKRTVTLEQGQAGKYIKCATRSAVTDSKFAISKPFEVEACEEIFIKTGFNPSDATYAGLDLSVIAIYEQILRSRLVQKKDSSGNLLYYEIDEEGNVTSTETTTDTGYPVMTTEEYIEERYLPNNEDRFVAIPDSGYYVANIPQSCKVVISYMPGVSDVEVVIEKHGALANLTSQIFGIYEHRTMVEAMVSLAARIDALESSRGLLGNATAGRLDVSEITKYLYPTVLYGHGVPSAANVPVNLPKGLPWNGVPIFIGQIYIDLDATSGGLYYATGHDSVSDWKQA